MPTTTRSPTRRSAAAAVLSRSPPPPSLLQPINTNDNTPPTLLQSPSHSVRAADNNNTNDNSMPSWLPRRRWLRRSRRRMHASARQGDSSSTDGMVLAEQGNFDEILSRLSQPQTGRRLGALSFATPADAAAPLHALLRFRDMPVTLVDALIASLQQASHEDLDNDMPAVLVPEESLAPVGGGTPLHVAVAHGCRLAVVQRLLAGDSLVVPAMTKDAAHQRFALHWATARPHPPRSSPWRRSADVELRWDTICFLLEQYPVAAVIPDVHGHTPLDYARIYKLHASIIDLVAYSAAQYERYAPPSPRRRVKKSPGKGSPTTREQTEATSATDSEGLLPVALPHLIGPHSTSQHSRNHNSPFLWGSDDVSSLGGDFPSHSSVSSMDSPLPSPSSGPIATVTNLFSSAWAFGGSSHGVHSTSSNSPMQTYSTPPHRMVPEATTEPRPGSSKPSPRSLLEPLTVASDDNSSSHMLDHHNHNHHHAASPSSGTVRSKSLLKGNLQVTSPRHRSRATPRKLYTTTVV
jgi:hypothetical protein